MRHHEFWCARIGTELPLHLRKAAQDSIQRVALQLVDLSIDTEKSDATYDLMTLLSVMRRCADALKRERDRGERNREVFARALTEQDQRNALLAILESTPATSSRKDRRATTRWMDEQAIFSRDAVSLQEAQQDLQVLATFLARLLVHNEVEGVAIQTQTANTGLGFELATGTIQSIAADRAEPWPLRVALTQLLGALGHALTAFHADCAQALLSFSTRHHDDPWFVAEALALYVQHFSDADEREPLLRSILYSADPAPDHRFLRARAVWLCARFSQWQLLADLPSTETSEHVRIERVRAIAASAQKSDEAAALLKSLILGENSERSQVVRAAGAIALFPLKLHEGHTALVQENLTTIGTLLAEPVHEGNDENYWLHDTVVEAILSIRDDIMEQEGLLLVYRRALRSIILQLICLQETNERPTPSMELRLRLGVLLNWLEMAEYPHVLRARHELSVWIEGCGPSAQKRFREGPVSSLDEQKLHSVLIDLASDNEDLGARVRPQGGYTVYKGNYHKFAPWRLFHELRHPAGDKRQAFNHFTDHFPRGDVIAISSRGSEVTATRVPGRRVSSAITLDWGCELPLPAHMVVAATRGDVRLLTPLESVHIKTVGHNWLNSQRNYVRLARARTRCLSNGRRNAAAEFDAILEDAGFFVHRERFFEHLQSPSVVSLFGAGLTGYALWRFAEQFSTISVEHASTWNFLQTHEFLQWAEKLWQPTHTGLPQLAVVAVGMSAYAVARNIYMLQRISRIRRRQNLVIGGWGSRGKSGTERLKAGLFHGLGYRVASKATGTEATFILSVPGTSPVEVPLFRPQNKASIWEQERFLSLADGLSAQVVLWECMALNPDYVQVLQRDWMRDDISTITNTYPDHENIQGPSGRDVAEVISLFLPKNAQAITTEQHMTPVLRAKAKERKTQLHVCAPSSWRLLPADLMARIPYDEHPRNVALVVQLARQLDIPTDVALRSMADHVVPDVGVLKEYGPATWNTRTLTFINGMAANERAGLMSNWQRMALGTVQPLSGWSQRVVFMVNNRADRLSRQAAFSYLCAAELIADQFVVVGTNVAAFYAQVEAHLRDTVGPELVRLGRSSPLRLVEEISRRLRRLEVTHVEAIELLKRQDRLVPEEPWIAQQNSIAELASLLAEENVTAQPSTGLRQFLLELAWLSAVREEALCTEGLGSKKNPTQLFVESDASIRVDDSRAQRHRGGDDSAFNNKLPADSAISTDSPGVEQTPDRGGLPGLNIEETVDTFLMLWRGRFVILPSADHGANAVTRTILDHAPDKSMTRVFAIQNIKGIGLDVLYEWIATHGIVDVIAQLKTADEPTRCRELISTLSVGGGFMGAALIAETLRDEVLMGRLNTQGLGQEAKHLLSAAEASLQSFNATSAAHGRKSSILTGFATWALEAIENILDFMDGVWRAKRMDRLYNELMARRVSPQRAAEIARDVNARQKGGWLLRLRQKKVPSKLFNA